MARVPGDLKTYMLPGDVVFLGGGDRIHLSTIITLILPGLRKKL